MPSKSPEITLHIRLPAARLLASWLDKVDDQRAMRMAQRVRDAIEREERKREEITSWAQLKRNSKS